MFKNLLADPIRFELWPQIKKIQRPPVEVAAAATAATAATPATMLRLDLTKDIKPYCKYFFVHFHEFYCYASI